MDPQSRNLNAPLLVKCRMKIKILYLFFFWVSFREYAYLDRDRTGQDRTTAPISPHPHPPSLGIHFPDHWVLGGLPYVPSKPLMDFGFLSCSVHPSIHHSLFF
jgi:hypothetical protein